MSLSLKLILCDEVKKLLDNFASIMKIQTVFFAADGTILQRGRHQTNSAYCQLIQTHFGGIDKCREQDRRQQRNAAEANHAVCYHCHAGLREVMAPVQVDGQLAGFIGFGQFRTEAVPPLMSADKTLQAELEKEFMLRPFFSQEELEDLLGLFRMLMDYIVARELVAYRGDRIWEQIRKMLDAGSIRDIKLTDLARHVGRSESTVAHLIKKRTGMTFKQLLIEKRLNMVDRLLKEHPGMSLGEIAEEAGFEDRYYFSRLYAKKRGVPPSEARRRLTLE
ncbi:MAG: PocR ligand-binding domain-containing protein [Victivallales bacterium]|nr:PocR ligand-binding domain-containing protein [Victivallales bacterium]